MNDQDKSDFKSDIDVIKRDIGKIKKSLGRIEKQQTKDRRSNLQQFLFSIGFAGMAAGMTLALTTSDYRLQGLMLFLVGAVMCASASSIVAGHKGEKK